MAVHVVIESKELIFGGDAAGGVTREAPVRAEPHPTRRFALPVLRLPT
jgi:hypothetical protein